MKPSVDAKAIVSELRALGRSSPTTEARKTVLRALDSKFEGIQAAAFKVLGSWADRESALVLADRLESILHKKSGWALRGVAVKQLLFCIQALDPNWVLDLCFAATDDLLRHELLPLASALPPTRIRRRVLAGIKDADPSVRQTALLILVRARSPELQAVLPVLATDASPRVRKLARYWLERHN